MSAQQTSSSDRVALDQRLIFRNTMKITPGHLEEYRQAILDAVSFAESHAPQFMVDVFIDEDELTATSFQIYADSNAVLRHWELSDPYIAKVMEHCTVAKLDVFGEPSDEVRAGFDRTPNMSVTVSPRLIGYLKSGPDRAGSGDENQGQRR